MLPSLAVRWPGWLTVRRLGQIETHKPDHPLEEVASHHTQHMRIALAKQGPCFREEGSIPAAPLRHTSSGPHLLKHCLEGALVGGLILLALQLEQPVWVGHARHRVGYILAGGRDRNDLLDGRTYGGRQEGSEMPGEQEENGGVGGSISRQSTHIATVGIHCHPCGHSVGFMRGE